MPNYIVFARSHQYNCEWYCWEKTADSPQEAAQLTQEDDPDSEQFVVFPAGAAHKFQEERITSFRESEFSID